MKPLGKKKGSGHGSKLTPETTERIISLIRNGAPLKTAAESAGVAARTLHAWIKRGETTRRQRDKAYVTFVEDVRKAKADGELAHLANITRAAVGDPKRGINGLWTASAWILERRNPEAYGRREYVEHAGEVKTIERREVITTLLADPEARKLASALIGRYRPRKNEPGGVGDGGEPRALGPGEPSNGSGGPLN